jgi:hypothetical protein
MLMRYHWGCAVGHIYAHQKKNLQVRDEEPDCQVYNEEHTDDYDDGSADDRRECDRESGRSDSDSLNDESDYLDLSDYDTMEC